MDFKLLASPTLKLDPQTTWAWYADSVSAFVVGDVRAAFLLPVADPDSPVPLQAAAPSGAFNLPMPTEMREEFAAECWHGFWFLTPAEYERVVDDAGRPVGDVLATLVCLPDYGTYVLHLPTGAVLSLRCDAMTLLRQRQSDGAFEPLDQTRTRGRDALAYAGHPSEPLIVYGDNFGAFHAHRFDPDAGKFAKAAKITDKQRKASRVEFVGDTLLFIGGMGYLASFAEADHKFTPRHEVSIPVRDFICREGGRQVLVNQGMHGVSAYRYEDGAGFTKVGATTPAGGMAFEQMAVSKCGRYVLLTAQYSSTVSVYAVR